MWNGPDFCFQVLWYEYHWALASGSAAFFDRSVSMRMMFHRIVAPKRSHPAVPHVKKNAPKLQRMLVWWVTLLNRTGPVRRELLSTKLGRSATVVQCCTSVLYTPRNVINVPNTIGYRRRSPPLEIVDTSWFATNSALWNDAL